MSETMFRPAAASPQSLGPLTGKLEAVEPPPRHAATEAGGDLAGGGGGRNNSRWHRRRPGAAGGFTTEETKLDKRRSGRSLKAERRSRFCLEDFFVEKPLKPFQSGT